MKITLLTNEYPPHVYGGAGVHVEYLTRELARLDDRSHQLQVYPFGDQVIDKDNLTVRGVSSDCSFPVQDPRHQKLMDTLSKDLEMAGSVADTDIVHCHTWYSHFAGCLIQQMADARLVLTTHSLEPHRPWKEEQLGSGYFASSWLEKTAYQNADGVVAVSGAMQKDVQKLYDVAPEKTRVIPNGIDLKQYQPRPNKDVLNKYDIDPEIPFVLFVGRITRQKGILHLVNAIKDFQPGLQVVLCAGAPDTKAIEEEMTRRVEAARAAGKHRIVWIPEMLPKDDIITVYSHAALFVCPSVYEPFGIINLEAMACKTPVVASRVGGIPEVVVPEKTGLLVGFETKGNGSFEPEDPNRFSADLARAVNQLMNDPERLQEMAGAARQHVEEHFSWSRIARQTLNFYEELLQQ